MLGKCQPQNCLKQATFLTFCYQQCQLCEKFNLGSLFLFRYILSLRIIQNNNTECLRLSFLKFLSLYPEHLIIIWILHYTLILTMANKCFLALFLVIEALF